MDNCSLKRDLVLVYWYSDNEQQSNYYTSFSEKASIIFNNQSLTSLAGTFAADVDQII